MHTKHPRRLQRRHPNSGYRLGGYVRLLPSLQRGSATAPEMATVNSRSTPWHHSPGSQQPADARSRRPGWHKRPVPGRQLMPHSAELKGAQIYRQQKARQANTYSETCLYRVLYGCGRMPGAAPASLTLGLRGTTDYHDQHKPTQPALGPEPSGLLLLGVETAVQRPYHMATSSRLALTWANGAWLEVCLQVKRRWPTFVLAA